MTHASTSLQLLYLEIPDFLQEEMVTISLPDSTDAG